MTFGDVSLSDGQIPGDHKPGAGGWPTIRYFNKETGYGGASYTKKTSKSMCDELGDEEYMQAYVEEMGSTSLCDIADGAGCSEQEQAFLAKTKKGLAEGTTSIDAQLTRLLGMKGSSMKPELAKWLVQRIAILTKLQASGETVKAEL